MKEEKMYSLAIRKRDNEQDHFWHHDNYEFIECKIDTCDGRYWFADPFLFEKDGKVYIFFEAFDLVQGRGKEGYCILQEDGSCTKPKIFIDEPYHLSFPYIFEYEEDIYIMPEMSADYSLKAYKAVSFPDKWIISDVLLPDVYACDSVFIETHGKRFLLTNEMFHNVPNGQYASCWVKNYLYELNGLKVKNDGVKVAEGDYGIRNAGKTFEENDILYRVGQDCRNRKYGKGLVLFKIDSLNPYTEDLVWSLTCDEMSNHIKRHEVKTLLGVHTYNFSRGYEIIDYSQMVELNSTIKRERFMRRISLFTKKISNRFMK